MSLCVWLTQKSKRTKVKEDEYGKSTSFLLRLENLSKGVFRSRISMGSKAFCLFLCLGATEFVLLSIFILIERICPIIWAKPLAKLLCVAKKRLCLIDSEIKLTHSAKTLT